MDFIHQPHTRAWISATPIPLGEYFHGFAALVNAGKLHGGKGDIREAKNKAKVMRNLMKATKDDLDETLFFELEEMCDVRHLTHPLELTPMMPNLDERQADIRRFRPAPTPTEAVESLQTVKDHEEFKAKVSRHENYSRLRYMRHQENWFAAMPPPGPKINKKLFDLEFVVTVRIYRPSRGTARNPASFAKAIKYNQEFQVLGSSMLTELRDHIKCHANYFLPGDVSSNPDLLAPKQAGEIYKSGFFYIEGTFYNDMRWPEECLDYSEVIRDWASGNPRRMLGPFSTRKMEETRISDLTVRFGYPYVYCHLGEHEHLISFTDARLVSVDDEQRLGQYPVERSIGSKHSKFCMVCSINISRWVTRENDRVPEDPYFFCDECFRGFNYDEKGKKIGEFKASQYVDVNAI